MTLPVISTSMDIKAILIVCLMTNIKMMKKNIEILEQVLR